MGKVMKVGLDVSMNSTGVVINIDNEIEFHKVISEMVNRHSKDCTVHSYDRVFNKDNYSVENVNKIISAIKQSKVVSKIITTAFEKSNATHISVRMEGSAMGGFGNRSRADDLVNFSAIMKREILTLKDLRDFSIVPPTTLKKFATGRGNASKKDIVSAFYTLLPDFDSTGKNDDIVDAFFLTNIESDNSNITTWYREDYDEVYSKQITSKSIRDRNPKKVKPKKTKKSKPKK